MRTEEEIKDKLNKLADELDELDSEFEENTEDEGIEEYSDE